MRSAVERIMDVAGDLVIDIVLGEIEITMNNPDVLAIWARTAPEVAEERG